MKRLPMMTGDTLGSAVVWKWVRDRSRFEAKLGDGSKLRASFQRRAREYPPKIGSANPGGFWTASVLGAWAPYWQYLGDSSEPFIDADAAKQAAFDWYMHHRPEGAR